MAQKEVALRKSGKSLYLSDKNTVIKAFDLRDDHYALDAFLAEKWDNLEEYQFSDERPFDSKILDTNLTWMVRNHDLKGIAELAEEYFYLFSLKNRKYPPEYHSIQIRSNHSPYPIIGLPSHAVPIRRNPSSSKVRLRQGTFSILEQQIDENGAPWSAKFPLDEEYSIVNDSPD